MSSPALPVRFGRRVREIRLRQGLSLETLAEKSGLNDKFIQAVETARQSPTIDTIEKLARGLGVELGELFTFEEESPAILETIARKRGSAISACAAVSSSRYPISFELAPGVDRADRDRKTAESQDRLHRQGKNIEIVGADAR
jgi:transcriptional regulator with XRE-family HTH domain